LDAIEVLDSTSITELDSVQISFERGFRERKLVVLSESVDTLIIGNYKRGERNGLFESFFRSGLKKCIAYYLEGTLLYYKEYDFNGDVIDSFLAVTFTGSLADGVVNNDEVAELNCKIEYLQLRKPYLAYILSIENRDTLSIVESNELTANFRLNKEKLKSHMGQRLYLSIHEFDLIKQKPHGSVSIPILIREIR